MAYEAAVDSYQTIQKQSRLAAKRILDPETNKLVVVQRQASPLRSPGQLGMDADEGVLLRVRSFPPCLAPGSRLRNRPASEADLMEILSRPRERKPQNPTEVIQ